MDALLKLFFILAPLIGQGIIQIQQSLGVNHPTIVGTVAGWLIAATLAGRGLATQDQKNVKAIGSDESGGGA